MATKKSIKPAAKNPVKKPVKTTPAGAKRVGPSKAKATIAAYRKTQREARQAAPSKLTDQDVMAALKSGEVPKGMSVIDLGTIDGDGKSMPDISTESGTAELGQILAKLIAKKRGEMQQGGKPQTFADAGPKAHKSCGCRAHFLSLASAEMLDPIVKDHGLFFPTAIADAISECAHAMNIKGVAGADDVVAAHKQGHGELAVALAKQPAMQALALSTIEFIGAMYAHGDPITEDDAKQVAAGLMSTVLAYAMTDMMRPPAGI